MMEKRGVIQPGITPPEDDKVEGEKTASLEELEDNPVRRLMKLVAESVVDRLHEEQQVKDDRNG